MRNSKVNISQVRTPPDHLAHWAVYRVKTNGLRLQHRASGGSGWNVFQPHYTPPQTSHDKFYDTTSRRSHVSVM